MGNHTEGNDPTCDDRNVVAMVLAGNRQAYADLVRRYHRPLLHLATSRLGDAEAAEDAVQDTFVAAYRSLHTYKPEFGFRTWLWTILLNQCRRHGGRLAKLPQQKSEFTHAPASHSPLFTNEELPPEVVAMLAERNHVLNELLHELPETRADAIRLRFFGQLKYREIADAMNSSLNAAKQRVRLGLVTMGELLRERELTDSVFPEDKT